MDLAAEEYDNDVYIPLQTCKVRYGEKISIRSSGSRSAETHSNSGGGGLIGMLAGAIVSQIASSAYDPSRDLATQADHSLIWDPHVGMLPGYYDPNRDVELKERGLAPAK